MRALHADAHQQQKGFSLVEIIVAMAILTFGILAVVPMLALNVRANLAARNYGTAVFLAQQKFEEVRSWNLWEDVDCVPQQAAHAKCGITNDNWMLTGTETNIEINGIDTRFDRTTTVLRNGYETGAGDCKAVIFTSGSGAIPVNEATGLPANTGSLNTGAVGAACSGGTRGEDFKFIRVTVSWDDMFGDHTITRHMYIAAF
ncbi:MAG TPA: prepilin-type N-terminal cleavage/methylation domain-containing protein [bacterium]|nr:prepilin-type N-terminal cleavage/methylation domain-containing protein [bacterium]